MLEILSLLYIKKWKEFSFLCERPPSELLQEKESHSRNRKLFGSILFIESFVRGRTRYQPAAPIRNEFHLHGNFLDSKSFLCGGTINWFGFQSHQAWSFYFAGNHWNWHNFDWKLLLLANSFGWLAIIFYFSYAVSYSVRIRFKDFFVFYKKLLDCVCGRN